MTKNIIKNSERIYDDTGKEIASTSAKIIKKLDVPTGEICIMQADNGKLEFVSLHDYGKAKNIKADFLGYTKEINQVHMVNYCRYKQNGLLQFRLNTDAR